MKSKPLKILSIPVDTGGCGNYRVRQPFNMINEFSDSQAHVMDKGSDDPIALLEALSQADILVVRQGGELGVDQLREATNDYAKETGKSPFHAKIVLDIDDNVEIISPYSEHYREYGTREYYDEVNKTWLWKQGENFNLVHNRSKIMSLMLGMQKADMVTVTTQKLADYAKQFNDHVSILPNAIDTAVWWKPPFKENQKLRVSWSGGHSHYEDWFSLKEPLNKMLRKHQFTLVMVGTGFNDLIDKDLQHLVEVWPWVPFEAHSYRMMLMNSDIAIIPLADLPFNHYKSAIKLYEMSAMGVPSLVANVLPYSKSGVNAALYYKDGADFERQLEDMISNTQMRVKLGLSALEEVHDKWSAKKHVSTYLNAYRSIL